MEIDTKKLKGIVNKLKIGLGKKAVMEQFDHFIFTGKDIVVYNGNTAILHPFQTDFVCSIQAEDLLKLIQGKIADVVHLSLSENVASLQSDDMQAQFATITGADTLALIKHILEQEQSNQWQTLPSNFMEGVKLCKFSVATNHTFRYFINLLFYGTMLISCDTKRASMYTLDGELPRFLLESKQIKQLVKLDFTQYFITEKLAFFRTDDEVRMVARRTPEPDTDYFYNQDLVLKLFSKFESQVVINLPDELLFIIDSISVMSDEDDLGKHLKISLAPRILTVQAQKEKGWAKQTMAVNYEGEPFTIEINPDFLKEILQFTNVMSVGMNQIMFHKENFYHIIPIEKQ